MSNYHKKIRVTKLNAIICRPVLETRDGNLLIASAKDRNISFLTFGTSTVNINDINLVDVSIKVSESTVN